MMETENDNALPRGWVRTTVGDISETINPGFPSGKHNKENRGVPHLRPMNISPHGEIDLSDVKSVEVDKYEPLKVGDVLFNNTNSPVWVGKTAVIKQDSGWAYSNHMTRIRPINQAIDSTWLSMVLHYFFVIGFFRANCTHHVNQASINSHFLSKRVSFPLPPLPEQHRIVAKIEELLTRLDAGVKALNAVKAQLKRYRQSVLRCAFDGKLTAEWRVAHKGKLEPASVLLERIKEERKEQLGNKYKELPPVDASELPELPEGWGWASVFHTAESMKNGIYRPPHFYGEQGTACLRMYNIEKGFLVWKDIKRMNLDDEEIHEYQLLPDDILVNRVNSRELVGKAAVFPSGLETCVYESKNIRLRLQRRFVESKFVNFWFLIYSQRYFNRNAQQTVGMASINQEQLGAMPIPLLSITEQQQIVSEIERHFSVADVIERSVDQSITQSERLRQSILKKAFEGKLVPQDPSDEPAERLLERIRADRKNENTKSNQESMRGQTLN